MNWKAPAILAVGLWAWTADSVRAEMFLSPEVTGEAGYRSNRFAESDAEGSSFVAVTPGLSLAWFPSEELEVDAAMAYRRTEYTKSGFEFTEATDFSISLWRVWPAWEAVVVAGGGFYHDEGLDLDDYAWGSLASTLTYYDRIGREYSLRGAVTQIGYDHRKTYDGDDQRGTHWELEPAVRRPLGHFISGWLSTYIDGYSSNENSEEYYGVGIEVGSEVALRAALRVGASARWGLRSYPNDLDGVVEDRSDHPMAISAWASRRVTPWAEWLFRSHWENSDSSYSGSDYDDFMVQVGLRLTPEFEVADSSALR